MRYTIFTERSRWNGNIHICAIFKTPREQELLGNLPAGVTSASDHCSAGRYGFHSTTPPPSLSAVSTHLVAWGCTKKILLFSFVIWFHVSNIVVTFSAVHHHVVNANYRLCLSKFQQRECHCILETYRHRDPDDVLSTLSFSGLTKMWTLSLSSCYGYRNPFFLDSWKAIVWHTHTQGWHTSKASTYVSSHVVQIRTFQHPHNVWLRLETARDIIIQEWECMANVLVWRATSVAPC